MVDGRIDLLRRVSFCAGLPDAALAALAAITVPVKQSTGSIIQLEGDPAAAMYIVVAGRVKIARIGANGREQVLNVIGVGGHFTSTPCRCSTAARARPTPRR